MFPLLRCLLFRSLLQCKNTHSTQIFWPTKFFCFIFGPLVKEVGHHWCGEKHYKIIKKEWAKAKLKKLSQTMQKQILNERMTEYFHGNSAFVSPELQRSFFSPLAIYFWCQCRILLSTNSQEMCSSLQHSIPCSFYFILVVQNLL